MDIGEEKGKGAFPLQGSSLPGRIDGHAVDIAELTKAGIPAPPWNADPEMAEKLHLLFQDRTAVPFDDHHHFVDKGVVEFEVIWIFDGFFHGARDLQCQCRGILVRVYETRHAQQGASEVPNDDHGGIRQSATVDLPQYGLACRSGRFAVITRSESDPFQTYAIRETVVDRLRMFPGQALQPVLESLLRR